MRFIDYGVLSGFEEYIDKERVQLAMKNSGLDYEEHIIQIPMTRLETIFDIFKIKQVDFMSVDVEGAELQALQGVNFEKVDIFVIISERRKGVEEFLESKGYIRFLKGELDDFFVRKDMISIEKLADVYSRFWTRAWDKFRETDLKNNSKPKLLNCIMYYLIIIIFEKIIIIVL